MIAGHGGYRGFRPDVSILVSQIWHPGGNLVCFANQLSPVSPSVPFGALESYDVRPDESILVSAIFPGKTERRMSVGSGTQGEKCTWGSILLCWLELNIWRKLTRTQLASMLPHGKLPTPLWPASMSVER